VRVWKFLIWVTIRYVRASYYESVGSTKRWEFCYQMSLPAYGVLSLLWIPLVWYVITSYVSELHTYVHCANVHEARYEEHSADR